MDWLHQHLLDQIVTETDLIFSVFCSLVSLLLPALNQNFEGNLKENLFGLKYEGNAGQNLVVQKSSFKFP